ncbi:hypothetical protein VTO73DRAFT_659 [Trametes versicolor]
MRYRHAVDNFYKAILTQPYQSPRPSYDALVSLVESFDDYKDVLVPPNLRRAFLQLARRRNHEDLEILPDALERFARLSSVAVNDYACGVFHDFLEAAELATAFHWLKLSMDMKSVTYASKFSTWDALLYTAAKRPDCPLVAQVLAFMHKMGRPSTPETSLSIFEALFSAKPSARGYRPPSYASVKFLIRTLNSCGYPYDSRTLAAITNGLASIQMDDEAKDAEVMYITQLGRRGLVPPERLVSVMVDVARRSSRDDTTRIYKHLVRAGLAPSETTFAAVLGDSDQLATLKHWENVLGRKASPRIIALLMERRAKANKSVADLYEYAVSTGIPLAAPMLQLFVKPLLTLRGLDKPTERSIDKALDCYRHFVAHLDGVKETSPSATQEVDATRPVGDSEDTSEAVKEKDLYPHRATYQLLLRAMTSTGNVPKYLPIAVSLVSDMRRFGVQLDSPSAASVIILLMHASPTPEEAFRMYRLIALPEGTSGKETVLNEEGYVGILDAFCTLPSWPNNIPSVDLYFNIISDMRKLGIPLGPKAYTVILAQMARLATAAAHKTDAAAGAREAIAKAIARIHNHLNLNPSFTPDTALWNQLMDAYQRAGCFAEACRIWQTLFASVRFNRASVSIILDACAYARAYDMAVRVYGALLEVEFPMNVKNWNTYLECLCRLGQLDEAMKVLCLEMTGRSDGVEPDTESVRILLKFAARENREGEVRGRLKRFLPKLYRAVTETSQ